MRGIYAGLGVALCAVCATAQAAVPEPTVLSDSTLDAVTAGQDLPEPRFFSAPVQVPGGGSGIGGTGSVAGSGRPLGIGVPFGMSGPVVPSIRPPIGVGSSSGDFSESSASSVSGSL